MIVSVPERAARRAALSHAPSHALRGPRRVRAMNWKGQVLAESNAGETFTAPITIDDLPLDPQRRSVVRGDRPIELTKTEFDLLELLMLNEGIVLERSTIYERIWGYDFGTSSKSLDVYIGYLRRKTEADGEHRLLHTVRGVGYVLRRG